MIRRQSWQQRGLTTPPSAWRMRWMTKATADLLTTILKMEEAHSDWAEKQRTQIEQMGLENYLANQTEGAAR